MSGYRKLIWDRAYDFLGNQAESALSPIASYEVYRDDAQMRTTKQTTALDVPSPGSHTYTVLARDLAGNVSNLSGPAKMTMPGNLAKMPDVRINDPASGTPAGASIVIDADAFGNGSPVRTMSMYMDGRKLGSHSGSSITRSWDPTPASVSKGAHKITVSATDYARNTGSATRTIYKP